MSGTVNISRTIWKDTAFKQEPFTEREAWMWLVMEASWKGRTKRFDPFVVDLVRGQLVSSVRFMAEAWSWTPAKVQRYLNRVEKRKMISRKTDTGVTVITIGKYDEYQNAPSASDTGPIQDRYRTDTNENKGLIPEERTSSVRSKPKPERFQEFWDQYPHRGGAKKNRKEALAKYTRAVASGVSEQKIISAAIRYASDAQVLRGYGRNPDVWLNNEGWNDDIEPVGSSRDTRSPARGGAHDSLYAGFASFANRDDGGSGGDFGGGETAHNPGGSAVDCGPGGGASQPILRIIGSS